MDQETADQLADEWMDWVAALWDLLGGPAYDRSYGFQLRHAMARELVERIPGDPVAAAVTKHPEPPPTVMLIEQGGVAVYTLKCLIKGDLDMSLSCERDPLDSEGGRVSVESHLRVIRHGNQTPDRTRETWSFHIGEQPLVIVVAEEGEEKFPEELARAMGWQLP